MKKEEFTPVFKECVDLIKEDYERALAQLDALNYLNVEEKDFKVTVNKEHLIEKVVAYRTLFPFFCSWGRPARSSAVRIGQNKN